jgi:septal ring factor EnvC (AmiA/AmiB activator)
MTLDKDFLVQLEHSFKRLAQSTEKVKQLTRERDQFEKQYLHLKDKVMRLKEERTLMAYEKDQLIQQCHKLEFRLKQAQVILNLGEQESSKSKTR